MIKNIILILIIFDLAKQISAFQAEQSNFLGEQVDCLKSASGLYEAKLNSRFYQTDSTYVFNFEMNYYPDQCLQAKVYGHNDIELEYTGKPSKSTIVISKDELNQFCPDDVCHFKYVVYIQDSIKKIFKEKIYINNKFTLSTQVKWAGKCEDPSSEKLSLEFEQKEAQNTLVEVSQDQCAQEIVTKESYKKEFSFNLCTDHTCSHYLDGRPYSYGNDVHAVIIINEISRDKQLKFLSATLDNVDIQSIEGEGNFGEAIFVSISPKFHQVSTEATLSVTFQIVERY